VAQPVDGGAAVVNGRSTRLPSATAARVPRAAPKCYVSAVKIVLSNLPPERADAIARTLVEERLAACINLLPIRSVYRWQGAVAEEPEVTLLIKVAADRVAVLTERLRGLHPYELPEILVLDIDQAHSLSEYVAWVRSESRPQ
jgi:periplasmic divalent cation tolerance protein